MVCFTVAKVDVLHLITKFEFMFFNTFWQFYAFGVQRQKDVRLAPLQYFRLTGPYMSIVQLINRTFAKING